MNELTQFFNNNKDGRLIHKWMHYFDIYDRHFSKYRNKEITVLEFGVAQGGSVQMWKEYFGPRAKIYGVDINHMCKNFDEENIEIIIGSQEDRVFLKDLKEYLPRIDILIDDGGHTVRQQKTTFEELYNHIAPNGVYLCEDINTSYKSHMGGGYKNPNSYIEFSKNYIDELYGWQSNICKELNLTEFTKSSDSMHYYYNVLVIEKKEQVRPHTEITGNRSFNFEKGETELREKRISYLQEQIKEKPTDFQNYKALGDLYLTARDAQNAINYLLKAHELNPSEAGICFSLANAYLINREVKESIKYHELALTKNSESPFQFYPFHSYLALGKIYNIRKNYSRSLKMYKKALNHDPNNTKIQQNIIQIEAIIKSKT